MSSFGPHFQDMRLRPPVIDLQQVRAWRHECQTKHGEECNNRYSELLSKHLENLILVDVTNQSLVILPSTTPFIALSYVWGAVPMFKALKSNISNLMKPGSLASNQIKIADTIRDAMHLVKSLGEQYLWVDCLCIVQDQDQASMDAMLRAMAHIYASADFTIAAADGGHANHGLRGTGGLSVERLPLGVSYRSIGNDSYPFDSMWATRGWTFQESLFSRRLLVLEDISHWLCGRSTWHEVLVNDRSVLEMSKDVSETTLISPSKREHLGAPMGLLSQITEFPCIEIWQVVIDEYSQRRLSFRTDLYRAIAGATEVLGPLFPGKMIHGLPLFFFDMVLLWQPSAVFSRRAGCPSWSWAGWNASMDAFRAWAPFYPAISSSYGDKGYMPAARLRRVATYLMQQTTNTGVGQWHSPEHLNEFHDYLAIRYDNKAELPMGWLRHDHKRGHYYTCSTAKDTRRRFSFPLPFADPCLDQVSYSPVLLCTAPQALVNIWEHPKHEDLAYLTEMSMGTILGVARMRDLAGTLRDSCIEVQVVALSETEVVDGERVRSSGYIGVIYDILELDHHYEGDAQEPPRFYNVMCIVWENDIAVRIGLGMVYKKVWDALSPSIITFKLK